MFVINLKTKFTIIISKLVLKLSQKFLKGGTNFPGKVALKLDNNILKTITKNYDVIFITGTNGKTTTTSMVTNVLKNSGLNVITNVSGANMLTGITSCFIDNYNFNDKNKKYAVIEVDEANLKFLTEYIEPEMIVITNLFRDQLDRYGEVYTTLEKILEGVKKVPISKLILNGDESLLGDLKVSNQRLYYGFAASTGNSSIDINADAKFCQNCKSPYNYNFVTYNHLGDFYCSNCGYKRPDLDYYVDELLDINSESSKVSICKNEVTINQPGLYNIYNALCAFAVASQLNIKADIIVDSLENSKSSFGRQEKIMIDGKELKIVLVKNPAGYNEAVNTALLEKDPISCAFLLNDNYADGRDVSWIWDVQFEKMSSMNINRTIIGGIRMYDMAIRLKTAGFEESTFMLCDNYDKILENIKEVKENKVYMFATYTAMTGFRKYLHSKGYIDKLWE